MSSEKTKPKKKSGGKGKSGSPTSNRQKDGAAKPKADDQKTTNKDTTPDKKVAAKSPAPGNPAGGEKDKQEPAAATTKDATTTASNSGTGSSEKKKGGGSSGSKKKSKSKELAPEELPNRAPIVDPYGEQLTREQERQRVEIKASTIPKGGNGVFALFDFAKDDVICEFVGRRCKREEAYNQMQYAIEFTNDDGETVLIDGWGYDNAAAIANDALGRTRMPKARNNARFWHYGNRMFLCAKRNIRKADEIFVQYGHEYWQMTKEDYHKVNNTDQIIELKLDTCH